MQLVCQKSRGVALADIFSPIFRGVTTNSTKFCLSKEDIVAVQSGWPKFARPCPKTPRHGFLDSRIVNTTEEALALWDQMKLIDSESELLLCTPLIESQYKNHPVYSYIMTEDGVCAVGLGHDGATAGKSSHTLFLNPLQVSKNLKSIAGIDENCYFEFVSQFRYSRQNYLVQARSGPKQPMSLDFIPADTVVRKIVTPIDDLLLWEEQVRTFEPGTVVYGAGHGLASHAAIHCVIASVPFITTKVPQIGETLSGSDRKFVFNKEDFLKGYCAANTEPGYLLLNLSIATLHNWANLQYSADASYLLGIMSHEFLHRSLQAIAGELRHVNRVKKSRDEVWASIDTTVSQQPLLKKARACFVSNSFSASFGGAGWANACNYAAQLGAGIFNENVADIISACNKLLNCSHNTGLLFTKFLSANIFDVAANNSGSFFLSSLMACPEVLFAPLLNARVPQKYDVFEEPFGAFFKDNIIGIDSSTVMNLSSTLFISLIRSTKAFKAGIIPLKVRKNSLVFDKKKTGQVLFKVYV